MAALAQMLNLHEPIVALGVPEGLLLWYVQASS